MYALYKLLPVSKKTYLNLFNMLSRSGSLMFVVKKLFLPRWPKPMILSLWNVYIYISETVAAPPPYCSILSKIITSLYRIPDNLCKINIYLIINKCKLSTLILNVATRGFENKIKPEKNWSMSMDIHLRIRVRGPFLQWRLSIWWLERQYWDIFSYSFVKMDKL